MRINAIITAYAPRAMHTHAEIGTVTGGAVTGVNILSQSGIAGVALTCTTQ